jgi:hypothetical protein
MNFISEEFRALMLDIWKVKFLQMPRFREVISSIPPEIRLSHFLNDGDSPDIPIPIYVGYLNQIRELARASFALHSGVVEPCALCGYSFCGDTGQAKNSHEIMQRLSCNGSPTS